MFISNQKFTLKIIIFETILLIRRTALLAISALLTIVGSLALSSTLVLGNQFDTLKLVVDFDDIRLVRFIFFKLSYLFLNIKDIIEVKFLLGSSLILTIWDGSPRLEVCKVVLVDEGQLVFMNNNIRSIWDPWASSSSHLVFLKKDLILKIPGVQY